MRIKWARLFGTKKEQKFKSEIKYFKGHDMMIFMPDLCKREASGPGARSNFNNTQEIAAEVQRETETIPSTPKKLMRF